MPAPGNGWPLSVTIWNSELFPSPCCLLSLFWDGKSKRAFTVMGTVLRLEQTGEKA